MLSPSGKNPFAQCHYVLEDVGIGNELTVCMSVILEKFPITFLNWGIDLWFELGR